MLVIFTNFAMFVLTGKNILKLRLEFVLTEKTNSS